MLLDSSYKIHVRYFLTQGNLYSLDNAGDTPLSSCILGMVRLKRIEKMNQKAMLSANTSSLTSVGPTITKSNAHHLRVCECLCDAYANPIFCAHGGGSAYASILSSGHGTSALEKATVFKMHNVLNVFKGIRFCEAKSSDKEEGNEGDGGGGKGAIHKEGKSSHGSHGIAFEFMEGKFIIIIKYFFDVFRCISEIFVALS